MGDTSITKVDSKNSPHGEMGQKYLASGTTISMRLWVDEQPEEFKPLTLMGAELERPIGMKGQVMKRNTSTKAVRTRDSKQGGLPNYDLSAPDPEELARDHL